MPVLIGALEYKTKGKPDAIHYVATLEEVAESEDGIDRNSGQGFADTFATSSEVNIADLVSKIKDESGIMVKFLPDVMLSEEQNAAADKARAYDATRYGEAHEAGRKPLFLS